MTKEFSVSINKCLSVLDDMDYLAHAVVRSSLVVSEAFKKSSLSSKVYRELYDAGMKNQDFNFILKDQSYFQFTERIKDEDVRLAYYPNPYRFGEYHSIKRELTELFDEGLLSQEELEQSLTEEHFSNDIPIIRYDLSLTQYCSNYHPAAHLHIGFNSTSRWPVRRVLTPYAFFLKILSHYYHDLWVKFGDIGDGNRNLFDVEYCKEVSGCRYLHDEYFQKHEYQRLHFS